MGNFSVTSAPCYHTHVSGLIPPYSPIHKTFGYGCTLEYLFLCTSEHFHFHFQDQNDSPVPSQKGRGSTDAAGQIWRIYARLVHFVFSGVVHTRCLMLLPLPKPWKSSRRARVPGHSMGQDVYPAITAGPYVGQEGHAEYEPPRKTLTLFLRYSV